MKLKPMNLYLLRAKLVINRILRPINKYRFVQKTKPGKLLLVGCGNGELDVVSQLFSEHEVFGIDIHSSNSLAASNEVICKPADFHKCIAKFDSKFDCIISSHNLEHCNFPVRTLIAIAKKIKAGGYIYISQPTKDSMYFPSRMGTLNFSDDQTHKTLLDISLIRKILFKHGIRIIVERVQYKPPIGWFLGLLIEPISKLMNKTFSYTWSYYGFEDIIIGVSCENS